MNIGMKIFFTLLLISVICSCDAGQKEEYENPEHYNLSEPAKLIMPESLLEISGITFYHNNADTIYAIQDEQGKLFRVPLGQKETLKTKFGKQGDYEDLAIMDENVFVLKSNGVIYTFPFAEVYEDETDSTAEFKNILPKGEYEGMFADSVTNTLYVLCKICSTDKKTNKVSGYTFKWQNNTLVPSSGFEININDIESLSDTKQEHFRPSAIAKTPVTNEWYILSSTDKLLVIADLAWKIKQVFNLDAGTFNQPEGIAFDTNNNLYISNEGSDIVNGNILRFDYTP